MDLDKKYLRVLPPSPLVTRVWPHWFLIHSLSPWHWTPHPEKVFPLSEGHKTAEIRKADSCTSNGFWERAWSKGENVNKQKKGKEKLQLNKVADQKGELSYPKTQWEERLPFFPENDSANEKPKIPFFFFNYSPPKFFSSFPFHAVLACGLLWLQILNCSSLPIMNKPIISCRNIWEPFYFRLTPEFSPLIGIILNQSGVFSGLLNYKHLLNIYCEWQW